MDQGAPTSWDTTQPPQETMWTHTAPGRDPNCQAKGALLRRLHMTGFCLWNILGDARQDRKQPSDYANVGTGASPVTTRSRGRVQQCLEDGGELLFILTVGGWVCTTLHVFQNSKNRTFRR